MQDSQTFYNPFHNIPRKKLDETIADLKEKSDNSLNDNKVLAQIIKVFYQYYNSNIPVDYWDRDMNNFKGNKVLVKYYNEVIKNIKESYMNGVKICFAGPHGCGKTMTTACILKKVVEGGRYNALYVNLTDIINILASSSDLNKESARKLLFETDFLVIDEFDSRFIGSEKASDLFGKVIEPVIRTRVQNKLPLFINTNSPNITDGFSGALQISISSLMNTVKVVPVVGGEDYRKVARGG